MVEVYEVSENCNVFIWSWFSKLVLQMSKLIKCKNSNQINYRLDIFVFKNIFLYKAALK